MVSLPLSKTLLSISLFASNSSATRCIWSRTARSRVSGLFRSILEHEEALSRYGTTTRQSRTIDCQGQFPIFSLPCTQCVGLRLFPGCCRIRPESSENPSDLEKELSVAIVADSPSGFHRSESCIDNECPNDVTRDVGRLGTVRKLVRLAELEGS